MSEMAGGEQGLPAVAGDSERPVEAASRERGAAETDAVITQLGAGSAEHRQAMGVMPGDDGAP